MFFPLSGGSVVSTNRETTQTTFDTLVEWAASLSPVYLAGALQRALELEPEPLLAARLVQLERVESEAAEHADTLEAAAATARRTAALAAERRSETVVELAAEKAEASRTSAQLHEVAAAVARAEAELVERNALEYAKAAAAAEEAHVALTAAGNEEAPRERRAERPKPSRRRQPAKAKTKGPKPRRAGGLKPTPHSASTKRKRR